MTNQSFRLRNSRSDLTVARQHAASGRFGDFLALCRKVAESNNRGQTTVFLKTPVLLTRGRVFSISALRMCRVFTEDLFKKRTKRTPTLVERFFKQNLPLAFTQQARAAIKKSARPNGPLLPNI